MATLTCTCGEEVSGPDAESVTDTMNRHLQLTGHSTVDLDSGHTVTVTDEGGEVVMPEPAEEA